MVTTSCLCLPVRACGLLLGLDSHAEERVVVDGTLTTSRGPGTSFEFALSLVKQLYGEEKAHEVAKPMVMYHYKI